MEYLRTDRSGDELITRTPELEVYIVNLHPLTPKGIPQDKDLVDDRENDIFFHDRTSYDEQVAYAFTDFVNMTRDLIELARSNGLSIKVDEILDRKAKTIARVSEYRFTTVFAFIPYQRDLKNVEIHLLDTGHFALEEEGDLIAELISRFLTSRRYPIAKLLEA